MGSSSLQDTHCIPGYESLPFIISDDVLQKGGCTLFPSKYERISGLYVKESKESKMGGKVKEPPSNFLSSLFTVGKCSRTSRIFVSAFNETTFFSRCQRIALKSSKSKRNRSSVSCFSLSPVRSSFPWALYHLTDIFFIMRNSCLFLINPTSNVYKPTDDLFLLSRNIGPNIGIS